MLHISTLPGEDTEKKCYDKNDRFEAVTCHKSSKSEKA